MLSRALSLAAAMLLIGFATVPVQAQNLEAGKSPSQIFSGSCTVCHKSPRGLLKTVAPGALPGFLRQHYTTSSDQAGALSAYLISNGASDKSFNGGGLTKQGTESRSEQKPAAAPEAGEPARGRRSGAAQETARPDADGLTPQEARAARRARRMARPAADAPDAAGKPVEQPEAEAAQGKQKHGKKSRRTREEAVKPGAEKDAPSDAKPAATKPVEEAPKAEAPATRADPVPAVTPAPAAPPAAPTDAPKP